MVLSVEIYVCDDCGTICTGPTECSGCGEQLKAVEFIRVKQIQSARTDIEWFLPFVRSMSLADHLGDVVENVSWVFKKMKFEIPRWHNLNELSTILRDRGIPYLHEID